MEESWGQTSDHRVVQNGYTDEEGAGFTDGPVGREEAPDRHAGTQEQAVGDAQMATESRPEGDTGVWGREDAELKCAWAYGEGAYFDGEMCSCKSGFTNVDSRCQESDEGGHGRELLERKGPDSRIAVLAKTGAKAATGVVLCTVMWDATALLGNPFAVPGLVDNALCGALAGLGLFGTR